MINKQILKSVKQEVWNTYIGPDVARTKYLFCQQTNISTFQFHCSHIIATSKKEHQM